jgi:hypothetical protein
VQDLISNLEGEVVDIGGHEPAQTIYVKVSEEDDQPMITWPHGGPHSVTAAGFSPEVVAFALCGCEFHVHALLAMMTNYLCHRHSIPSQLQRLIRLWSKMGGGAPWEDRDNGCRRCRGQCEADDRRWPLSGGSWYAVPHGRESRWIPWCPW